MPVQNNTPVTACQVLLPVALVSFILFLSLSFQTVQIMRDRDALKVFHAQQDKPVEDSRKLQQQLSALALGTKKMAENGNKDAALIISRLQQLGITVESPNAAPAAPQPTPAK